MIDPKIISYNIRNNLKRFFLDDLIGKTPHLGRGRDIKNTLLILDDKTTRVLDSFMGVIDLVEAGIIGIEKLSAKRKRFSKFHAIYFIEPSEESITFMLNDFFDERTIKDEKGKNVKQEGPLYDFVHVVFCNKIDEMDLEKLTTNKNFVYACISMRQVNMDILTIDENLYSLEFKKEDKLMNKEISEKQEKIVLELVNQAMSVYTLIKKVENVQIIYHKGGAAEKFVVDFKIKTQKMINKVFKNKTDEEMKEEFAPVFFVVINRGFDMLSPFLREMTYSGLYFNLLQQTEHKLKFEIESEKNMMIEREARLNETDPLWLNYKYQQFPDAMAEVSKSYQTFVNQNSKQKGGTINEMVNNLRSLPQFKEFIKDYSKHLNNMMNITKAYKEQNFRTVFEYEQGIATGQSKLGEKISFSDIKRKNIPNPDDRIRLALIAHNAFNFDMETISKALFPTENDLKMKYKGLSTLFDKARENEIDILKPSEEGNSTQYYKPKIIDILIKLTKNKLFNDKGVSKRFKRHILYPEKSKSKCFNRNVFKKKGLFSNPETEPIVVFFYIGGMSYCEAQPLIGIQEAKNYGDFKILCGGTNLYSPFSLIKKYSDLNSEKKLKAQREREFKRMRKLQKEEEERNKKKNAMFAVLEEGTDSGED